MSYEGHEQYMCAQGHFWTEPYDYGQGPPPRCGAQIGLDEHGQPILCNGKPVWENSVDDTNCDAYGEFLEEHLVEIAPQQIYTCPHCKQGKLIADERYEIPEDPVQVYRTENHLDGTYTRHPVRPRRCRIDETGE